VGQRHITGCVTAADQIQRSVLNSIDMRKKDNAEYDGNT